MSRGSPGNADSQASDADGIGIYPVHTWWTIVDGVDRSDVGRIGGNWRYGKPVHLDDVADRHPVLSAAAAHDRVHRCKHS